MDAVKCPNCGQLIETPKRSSSTPWLVGCLIGVVVLPVAVGVIGLLAAIAVPSFVKARETSQTNACYNNLMILEDAKEQWAAEHAVPDGTMVDEQALWPSPQPLPACPAGGAYTLNPVGDPPSCSLHGATGEHRLHAH